MADLDHLGQLFMVDFTGMTPAAEVERLIAEEKIGGVTLFDKNVTAPGQVAALTNALQTRAAAAGAPPLLIGADQEGGPVVRLRPTHFPSAMAFGAAGSEALVASAAAVTARELRATGIHIDFAPAVDVNNNPANPVIGVRSYGEDPDLVARLGVQAVTAMQSAGVIATVKHFPGHGDTTVDSHLSLPTVAHPRSRLEAVELKPFRAAIRAGVEAVMTAHVVYPALDPKNPATLSPAIIGMLRHELGFRGLVVTDSMRMLAIADRYSPGEAAVQAVLAGADLILALGPTEVQREAIECVRAAAASGRIPSSRIAEAAERVLAAKRRLGLFARAVVDEAAVAREVGTPEHLALADRVAQTAATVVRDRAGMLPLPAGAVSVVAGAAPEDTVVRLAAAIRAAGRDAAVGALEGVAADGRGSIVIPLSEGPGTVDPAMRARGHAIVKSAVGRGPTVVIATGTPYGLTGVPDGAASVAVYGSDPASLRAAAGVLIGSVRPQGRLPVTVAA